MRSHATDDSLNQWNARLLYQHRQNFKGQQTLPKRNELSDSDIDLQTSRFQTSL